MKHYFLENVDVTIEKLIANGQGLAKVAGEAVLVPGALAGERLRVNVGAPLRGVRRGRIVEILAPSPHRIAHDCAFADRCGGCDFLHVKEEAALRLKAEAALGEAAASWGLPLNLIESPLRARYRTRVTLHLAVGEDGRAGLGFYDEKRSLVEFDDCLLMAAKLAEVARALSLWAKTLPVEAATGAEFCLTLGEGESGVFIAVAPPPAIFKNGRRTASPKIPPALLERLPALADRLPAAIFARPAHGAPLKALTASAPKFLPVLTWPERDLTLFAGPGEFTQVNPFVNRLMVGHVLEEAAPLAPTAALDLYSGHGNFSLPLAKSGFTVTAVEESPEAVQSARYNARAVKIEQLRARSEKAVEDLKRAGRKFPLIVLDPPRAGARDLAPALAALRPHTILYVACHPSVLTRDVPAFISLGYTPQKLTALDMFPRTSHFETVMALRQP